ncbi:hypothetical protein RF11_02757 [Thelohanellus kitauei]|uniref:Uncharacterized protein n=1 Tax=Thelohanellus kitauei TaxID=669202 RepID=A0A0C2MUI8_THEKT|nr:hypothetical protein RF11_02757 [Thelohanellus kitauei]
MKGYGIWSKGKQASLLICFFYLIPSSLITFKVFESQPTKVEQSEITDGGLHGNKLVIHQMRCTKMLVLACTTESLLHVYAWVGICGAPSRIKSNHCKTKVCCNPVQQI